MNQEENGTEQRGNQQELIFNHSVDLTFLMGVEGDRYRFITVNNAFLAAAHKTRGEVEGKYAEEVIPEQKYPAIAAKYDQAIQQQQTVQWEDTSDYPDGRRTTIVTVTPLFNETGVCTMLVGTLHDITERKKAEEALASREKQLDLIYNTVGDIIFLLSIEAGPRYRFSSVNNAFLSATGLTFDQIEGKYADEVIPEPARGMVLANYQQAIDERRTIQWEETSEYPAGKKVGIVSINPVFNSQDECTMLVGTVHDITDVKKALEEKEKISYQLNERIKELTTLYRTDQILQAEARSTDKMLHAFVNVLPPGWQYPEITEACITLGDKQYKTTGYGKAVSSQSASFVMPGGMTGILEVIYTEEKPEDAEGPFLAEERNLINMLAEKLRVYFAKKVANDHLVREKKLSDGIIEALPGLFYMIDENGRYQRWNKLKETISGYTHEEMTQMNSLDFFEGAEKEMILNAIKNGFKTGHTEVEAHVLTKDKRKILHYFTGVTIDYGGKTCLMGMGMDITERKKVEEQNRKNEERFRVLVDSAPDATVIVDEQGIIQMVNRQTEAILGYQREELIGKPVEILIPAELHAKHHGYRHNYQKEPRTREMGMGMELFAVKKDGSKLPVEISLAPFHSDEGVQIIASLRDITERKKTAEQLLKEKELSESIINSLPGIFYLFDTNGKYLRWNKNHETVPGYTTGEMENMFPLNFFDTDEKEMIGERIGKVFTEGYADAEANFLCKDGRKIPYYFNGVAIMYEGKPCLMGVGIDITQRKEFEYELQEAEIKFRTLVEKSLVGVYIVQKAKFVYVNPRFAEIFGYSQEELLNSNPIETIISEDYRQIVTDHVRSRLEGEIESIHYEVMGIKKDGTANWVEFFGSRTIYEGKPTIIGTMIDITERKQAEEALQKSEANLQSIFDTTDTMYTLLNKDFTIISFNQRADDNMKTEMGQRLKTNTNIINYFPAERQPQLIERMQQVLAGKNISYESAYPQKDGSYHWLHVRMYPITTQGKKIFGLIMAISDITEKKLLEQKMLTQRVEEQKRITRAVLNAQEKERNSIGQELHDNVNQILVGAKIFLGLTKDADPSNGELIKKSMGLIDKAVDEIRYLTREQVTPQKKIDLKDLIQSLVEKLNEQTAVETTFNYDIDKSVINDDLKLNIYRIIQEGINNIVKHAAAKHVTITIKAEDKTLYVSIIDDGKGLDTSKKPSGIGINNILNRVESYNGKIAIDSTPQKGCKIELAIPL